VTERPSWDETWMSIADNMALRSPCGRAQVGAVIVTATNRIVATGYNGAPAHLTASFTDDCKRWCPHSTSTDPSPCYDDCFSIHAEANALMFCDRRDREGGTLYVTTSCCFSCAKQVANSGLARVVMRRGPDYRKPQESIDLLERCRLRVTEWRV